MDNMHNIILLAINFDLESILTNLNKFRTDFGQIEKNNG